MNTSKIELLDDFECHYELPDSQCGAKNDSFYDTDQGISCTICQVTVETKMGDTEDDVMQSGDEGGDDDDEDFIDDVTVQQSEMTVNWTPEQVMENSIMTALDTVKNGIRTSNNQSLQVFGEWIHKNRFDLRQLYVIAQTQSNFFTLGDTMANRAGVLVVTYATFVNKQDIPDSFFEMFSKSKTAISDSSERLYKEYSGKKEPLVLFYIKTYGRQLQYDGEVIDLASELWTSAEPIYVNAKESLRGLVWVVLTNSKVTGKKINRARVSRITGVDTRTIKRIQDKYEHYFK